jgi:hypothetical protein
MVIPDLKRQQGIWSKHYVMSNAKTLTKVSLSRHSYSNSERRRDPDRSVSVESLRDE